VADSAISVYNAIFGEVKVSGNQPYSLLQPEFSIIADQYSTGILSSVLKHVERMHKPFVYVLTVLGE